MNFISKEDAVSLVRSHDHIVTGLGGSEARDFLSTLPLIADQVEDVHINTCLPLSELSYADPQYKDSFFMDSWFYGPVARAMQKTGNASFFPNNLHFASIKRFQAIKPRFFVGVCTPPDRHGFVSLSTGNTYERRAIEASEIVILEMNENYPRTFGDVELPVSKVDYFIRSDYPVPTLPDIEPNERDFQIGKLIAAEIEDGDTIQIGIGGIPNAVAKSLYGKKDLGIHTEMLTTEIAKLAKAGVVTGAKKTLHRDKIVTAFILGNEALYDFVDDNPSVLVLDGSYVNNPATIAKNDNQVSINTTLEIDLTGQCCSESIGSVQYSGTGGQTDTATGAQAAKNGRSFIALHATASVRDKETGERKEKSKIVSQLARGAYVSLSRNDVDRVVTEYGIAHLRGTTVKERVERLIAIAHPAYREQLRYEAKAYGILGGF
jgi:acyl-CoA hydrolase